jgi:hypothetical protein
VVCSLRPRSHVRQLKRFTVSVVRQSCCDKCLRPSLIRGHGRGSGEGAYSRSEPTWVLGKVYVLMAALTHSCRRPWRSPLSDQTNGDERASWAPVRGLRGDLADLLDGAATPLQRAHLISGHPSPSGPARLRSGRRRFLRAGKTLNCAGRQSRIRSKRPGVPRRPGLGATRLFWTNRLLGRSN